MVGKGAKMGKRSKAQIYILDANGDFLKSSVH